MPEKEILIRTIDPRLKETFKVMGYVLWAAAALIALGETSHLNLAIKTLRRDMTGKDLELRAGIDAVSVSVWKLRGDAQLEDSVIWAMLGKTPEGEWGKP